MEKSKKTGKKCPQCGKALIVREGKFGKFLGCSDFPDCKYTEQLDNDNDESNDNNENGEEKEPENLGKCPKCSQGNVVKRHTRKSGKLFYGCGKYPDCDFATWNKEDLNI